MPAWLLVGSLLLVRSFSQTKGCTGPERNAIQTVLNNVNWKTLADQLNLTNQVAAIQDVCKGENDVRPCYFRELVSRYIQTQSEESCDNTRRKIASALEQLGYVNEAGRLIGGGQTSTEGPTVEPITQPPSPAASGPTLPPSITENSIIYWILSTLIIAVLTWLLFIIIRKLTPTRLKKHDEDQGKGVRDPPDGETLLLDRSLSISEGAVKRHPQRKGKIDLKDDIVVQDLLKNLNKEELKGLFRRLGLSPTKVENKYEGSSIRAYADDLVKSWILQDDDVKEKGGATWESLQVALRKIDKTGIAGNVQE